MDKIMKSISVAFQGRCYEIKAYRAVAAEDYDGEGRVPVESRVQWLSDGFTLVSEGGKYDDFEQKQLPDTDLYPEDFMEANYADYCECVTSRGGGRVTIRIPEDEEFDPSKVCMVTNEWYMPDSEDEMVYALLYDGRVCRLDADKVEPKEGSRLVAGENPNNPGLRFENNPNNNNSEPHDVKANRKNAMAYELSLRVDSERVGVYSCDQNNEYIEKLLPLIDKYNAGVLVEEDKEFIREIFDEISDNGNEWYDANTIRELYVDDESYDVDDVEINDNDSVANNIDSDYCIVSYFKWRNQTLSGEIETEDFDIDLLSVECVKTIFTQGHSFNSSDGIKYNGEPVYCEENAGKSDTFHLKIYKKEGDSYIKLADFNFDKLDSNQTNTNQEPKTLLEYLKHIEVTRIDDDDDETIFFSIDGAHGEMSESDSEQYDLFVHNYKKLIFTYIEVDEVWDKISSVKLSNDDMNDLESNWEENAVKYFGTGDDETDELLSDNFMNCLVTAAWLTSKDIDYVERWENEDLEDLYDDEYRYCVSIDGSYVFNCEMDIDLT